MATDAFLKKTYKAREKYTNTLGVNNPDFVAPLVNPAFVGGPMWPDLRQAWRVIHNGTSTIIMSDGLSDPFSDDSEPNTGFGLEVHVESTDPMPEQVQTSWLFDLCYQVSQQCADHGGVRDLIEELELVSLELPMSDSLQPVATINDRAGVLLGVKMPNSKNEFALPGGMVLILTAKLLWPSELEYAASKGTAGRKQLAKLFATDGTCHQSSMHRQPVV